MPLFGKKSGRTRPKLPGDGTKGYYSQEFLFRTATIRGVGVVVLRYLRSAKVAQRIAKQVGQTVPQYIREITILPSDIPGAGFGVSVYVKNPYHRAPDYDAVDAALERALKFNDIIPGYQQPKAR